MEKMGKNDLKAIIIAASVFSEEVTSDMGFKESLWIYAIIFVLAFIIVFIKFFYFNKSTEIESTSVSKDKTLWVN